DACCSISLQMISLPGCTFCASTVPTTATWADCASPASASAAALADACACGAAAATKPAAPAAPPVRPSAADPRSCVGGAEAQPASIAATNPAQILHRFMGHLLRETVVRR